MCFTVNTDHFGVTQPGKCHRTRIPYTDKCEDYSLKYSTNQGNPEFQTNCHTCTTHEYSFYITYCHTCTMHEYSFFITYCHTCAMHKYSFYITYCLTCTHMNIHFESHTVTLERQIIIHFNGLTFELRCFLATLFPSCIHHLACFPRSLCTEARRQPEVQLSIMVGTRLRMCVHLVRAIDVVLKNPRFK